MGPHRCSVLSTACAASNQQEVVPKSLSALSCSRVCREHRPQTTAAAVPNNHDRLPLLHAHQHRHRHLQLQRMSTSVRKRRLGLPGPGRAAGQQPAAELSAASATLRLTLGGSCQVLTEACSFTEGGWVETRPNVLVRYVRDQRNAGTVLHRRVFQLTEGIIRNRWPLSPDCEGAGNGHLQAALSSRVLTVT